MDLSIFGYLAAIYCYIFLPQAIKTVRTKNTDGLSLMTYVFLFFGSLFGLSTEFIVKMFH